MTATDDVLVVREMQNDEVDYVIQYFLNATPAFLHGMGVDPLKLPSEAEWQAALHSDFERPLKERAFFYLLWINNGQPIGHSNINKIEYQSHAFMHLHIWATEHRQSGFADFMVRQSVKHYFERFELKKLFCEPYALNPAPNKTLPKAGFRLLETYTTIPGWINFEQPVNRWVLNRDTALSNMGHLK